MQFAINFNGPGIKTLHKLHRLIFEQWPNETINEAWVHVANVRIDPSNNITFRHIEAFPECLAFSCIRTYFIRQNLLMDIAWNAKIFGNLACPIDGVAINQHN